MEFLDDARKKSTEICSGIGGLWLAETICVYDRAHLKEPARGGTAEGGPPSRLGATPRHASPSAALPTLTTSMSGHMLLHHQRVYD
jgi:hypothetical protein